MKIGILVTGHVAEELVREHGEYDRIIAHWLRGHGFSFEAWFVVDGQFPPGPDAADGWIISGSKHGAYEDHPWIAPLEQLIREIVAAGRPLLGICFGHQIIAQALGGRVEKFAGGWSVGHTVYDTTDGPLTLDAWHQDQVVALPEGARVLGGNAFCPYAVLAYGDRVLSYQPHPEFTAGYTQGLLDVRGPGVVPDPLLDAARARTGAQNDAQRVADRVAAFLQGAEVAA
jgi:GMP synthase (glutamine-hydrolysing)